MSIQQSTFAPPATAVVVAQAKSAESILPSAPQLRRFSVDEYHRMIELGILTENDKVELVDGWIVNMSPVGPSHFGCIQKLLRVFGGILPQNWHLRSQGPLTLATGEPEPDITIARGNIDDWMNKHPGGSDIAIAIEVADSSLAWDRTGKQQQYSAECIAEFWIVNLVDRQLEVYREPQAASTGPEYRIRQVFTAEQSVQVSLDGKLIGTVNVADLLP